MLGIVVIIVVLIIMGVIDLGRDTSKTIGIMNRSQIDGRPYWTDASGQDRLKSNNKKVTIRIDSEGHYIATDRRGNVTDLTFENDIKPLIKSNNGVIWPYGNNEHMHDKIPGTRYVECIDGKYVFYVVVIYDHTLEYYVDVESGKVIKPTYYTFKQEEKAEELGLEYYTKNDIYNMIQELNRFPIYNRKVLQGNLMYSLTRHNTNDIDKHLRFRIDLKRAKEMSNNGK